MANAKSSRRSKHVVRITIGGSKLIFLFLIFMFFIIGGLLVYRKGCQMQKEHELNIQKEQEMFDKGEYYNDLVKFENR